jgi:kynurenine 3-monooxygenase
MKSKTIAIAGGGLVGSLLSLYLVRRGYQVQVFERRPDMRTNNMFGGRSINLALSARGIAALAEVGLADSISNIAIPMHGRMVHDVKGNLSFQPYGKEGQFINSISRSDLNILLINAAEAAGVEFLFEHRCIGVNAEETEVAFKTRHSDETQKQKFDLIIGADGAFSSVRSSLQVIDRFNYSQFYIEHGYKELHIPANPVGGWKLEKNSLHIWPRESFMMIALPNPDGSFTCTLFFPFEGELSFESLRNREEIERFFQTTFPDAVPLMPALMDDYRANPTSSLVTIKCFPWVRNRTLVIGDAAHAIVPFYGQGMNAGFEDCRILNDLLHLYNDQWSRVLPAFENRRKPDTDAISQLAMDNFVEMRDHVADADFILRKKIEARLHEQFPERWIPLYTMVTFTPEIRYSDAYAIGMKQKAVMDRVLQQPGIETNWQRLDFRAIVDELDSF